VTYNKILSKYVYVGGLKCQKWLWLKLNAPDKLPPKDESTSHLFDQGLEVGQLAQQLSKEGIDANPDNDGEGGPGYTIPAEFKSSLKHVYGALGAARTNNPEKASSGSQFYIVTNRNGTSNLNMNYTVFGQVILGLDTAYTLSTQPKNALDRPLDNIVMQVKVVKFTIAELKSKFNFDVAKADSL
jgi:cyclophilin family peptidyl-prolyl cis-trans isomerase